MAFETAIASSEKKTIDLVISCAGLTGKSIFQDEPFLTSDDPEDPQEPPMDVIDVNLTGAYYTACLTMHYFRHAKVKEDKQLILFASTIAYRPIPLFSNYSASKAGVRALWKSLRESPDLTGMRTNLVAPHIVRTPMTAPLQPILDEQGLKFAEPEEVLDIVMRFVCDEGIRGRSVAVNAGNAFDLCDSMEEGDGSRELGKVYGKETGPVLEFMAGMLRSGTEPAKSQQS